MIATFVLGDVVGSTRAWVERGDQMPDDLAALDAVVDAAAAKNNGERPVEQGEGDSFVVTFPRPSDAVAFAIEVQRSGLPLPLRMAVHTGDAERRDDGRWLGPTLNRCARLRELAAGGQVLVSGATAELVVDAMPDGAFLRDLGRHRLRDLSNAEHVRQLCHPDLAADFPPLPSLDRVRTNLPAELSTFVGRQAELDVIDQLLRESRLVTLTGAGGAGKTRLAIHAAARLLDRMSDGVWFVDFAGVGDPSLVPNVVAAAINQPQQPLQPVTESLLARLSDETALIVLDNCEHLLDAAARLADTLLRGCAGLRLLATSREPLGVAGEVVDRVPSMIATESMQLFTERARVVRPGFILDGATSETVAELCDRLDGIPLAIELAAARVRMMAPTEIVEQLTDRFRILSAGRGSVALPRQRTLEASVQWSFDLLSDDEAAVLRRLTVFVGGFTLAGAERVGASDGIDAWSVVDLLAGLVDKSLVQVEDAGHRTRYRLLETVRIFATQRLAEAGEVDAARAQHLAHMVEVAEVMEVGLYGEVVEALAHFGVECDNLRAALDWAVETGRHDDAWRLLAATFVGWESLPQEAVRRIATVAGLPGGSAADRVTVAIAGTYVAMFAGDFAAAQGYVDAATQTAEAAGEDVLKARAQAARGAKLLLQSDEAALGHINAAATVHARLGDDYWLLDALTNRAICHLCAGDLTAAADDIDRSLFTARRNGDIGHAAFALVVRAFVLGTRGLYVEAEAAASAGIDSYAPAQVPAMVTLAAVVPVWALSAAGEHGGAVAAADAELAYASRFGLAVQYAFTGWVRSWVARRAGHAADDVGIAEAEVMTAIAGLPYGPATLKALRADHALTDGDVRAAAAFAAEAEAAAEASKLAGWAWPSTRRVAARVALARGEVDVAEDKAHLALARYVEMDPPWGVAEALETLAAVAAELESPIEAARLIGGAAAIRERVGWAYGRPDEAELAVLAERLTAVLGADGYAAARAEGAAMTQDEVVVYAQRGRGERKRPSFGWASLTPTESEVVRLVSEGLANKAIAEKLFVSPATVKTHLTHIYAKLAVASRTDLAAQVAQRG